MINGVNRWIHALRRNEKTASFIKFVRTLRSYSLYASLVNYIWKTTLRSHLKDHARKWWISIVVPGKTRRRASESPRRPRKKRKHSKSPNILHGVVQDVQAGLESRLELFGLDGDQDLALINFERTRETLSDSCEYPQLHRSASYFPQSTAQL